MVLTGTVLFASATTLTLAVLVSDPAMHAIHKNSCTTKPFRNLQKAAHHYGEARGSKATENSGLDRYGLTIELWTSID